MNFEEQLNQSVSGKKTINKMINKNTELSTLIPNLYQCQTSVPKDFLKLLAGGTVPINYPFSFSFTSLDCNLLLYTLTGSCKLTSKQFTGTIGKQNGLLLNCKDGFSLQTSVLPWKFKLFFIDGTDLASFNLLTPHSIKPFIVADHSSLQQYISKLSGIPSNYSGTDALLMHKTLTDLFCELYEHYLPATDPLTFTSIPPYLTELKNYLDYNYQANFLLSDFEETLKVNKYRLCREFSKAYGAPPLRYLKQRRIEVAKEMLLTTDYNIHEISSIVGYENTNHFINLFKKATGLTPNVFKQTVLEKQSALRSPAQ
ncbi:MAG: AraC family transcriptional regulator [bacterium]|nr:AraC family transcriptional regulator [bacterium]